MANAVFFHVTSSANRASITEHGLDVGRMGAARGIAGSRRPEQEGCFLALDEYELRWFVSMNNTGGPVDVWEVRGVTVADLVESPEGYYYLPGTIPAMQVSLITTDVTPER